MIHLGYAVVYSRQMNHESQNQYCSECKWTVENLEEHKRLWWIPDQIDVTGNVEIDEIARK